MKLRHWLSSVGFMLSVTSGVIAGGGLAIFSGALPAMAYFEGDFLVSLRGMGDTNNSPPTTVSAPMFYTTAIQGVTAEGAPGRLPTGHWAPGDAWERTLLVKNQQSKQILGLKRLQVALNGDVPFAAWYRLSITGPENRIYYEGTLDQAATAPIPFTVPIRLKPGELQTLTFRVSLDLAADNPWQGRFVKANFEVDAEAMGRPVKTHPDPETCPDPHDRDDGDDHGDDNGDKHTKSVTLYGASDLEVSTLDWRTARFGKHASAPLKAEVKDVDHDGCPDLIVEFPKEHDDDKECDSDSRTITIKSFVGERFEGDGGDCRPSCD